MTSLLEQPGVTQKINSTANGAGGSMQFAKHSTHKKAISKLIFILIWNLAIIRNTFFH